MRTPPRGPDQGQGQSARSVGRSRHRRPRAAARSRRPCRSSRLPDHGRQVGGARRPADDLELGVEAGLLSSGRDADAIARPRVLGTSKEKAPHRPPRRSVSGSRGPAVGAPAEQCCLGLDALVGLGTRERAVERVARVRSLRSATDLQILCRRVLREGRRDRQQQDRRTRSPMRAPCGTSRAGSCARQARARAIETSSSASITAPISSTAVSMVCHDTPSSTATVATGRPSLPTRRAHRRARSVGTARGRISVEVSRHEPAGDWTCWQRHTLLRHSSFTGRSPNGTSRTTTAARRLSHRHRRSVGCRAPTSIGDASRPPTTTTGCHDRSSRESAWRARGNHRRSTSLAVALYRPLPPRAYTLRIRL